MFAIGEKKSKIWQFLVPRGHNFDSSEKMTEIA